MCDRRFASTSRSRGTTLHRYTSRLQIVLASVCATLWNAKMIAKPWTSNHPLMQTLKIVLQHPMQRLSRRILAVSLAVLGGSALAGNPFVASIYTADPSAHVWKDGRLYVY